MRFVQTAPAGPDAGPGADKNVDLVVVPVVVFGFVLGGLATETDLCIQVVAAVLRVMVIVTAVSGYQRQPCIGKQISAPDHRLVRLRVPNLVRSVHDVRADSIQVDVIAKQDVKATANSLYAADPPGVGLHPSPQPMSPTSRGINVVGRSTRGAVCAHSVAARREDVWVDTMTKRNRSRTD